MDATSAPLIQPLTAATESLLALNNDHSIELSPLSLPELDRLIQISFFSASISASNALLISFDRSAPYDNENFLWFQNFFSQSDPANPNFVYVDRVVTSPAARGKGYARALYSELFRRAKSAGHSRIVCEVNYAPPNPVSDAFHASLNFQEVGRASVYHGTKKVRYLLRPL
jgi:hypothetical protein